MSYRKPSNHPSSPLAESKSYHFQADKESLLRISDILRNYGLTSVYQDFISSPDAYYLSKKFAQEAQDAQAAGHHYALKRVEKSEIQQRAKNGCFLVKDESNTIVACIFCYRYHTRYRGEEIFERVTLWREKTLPHYQDFSLGSYLMRMMTNSIGNKPLLSVTDNEHVVKKNKNFGFHVLQRKHLPPQFKHLLNEYKTLSDKNYADKFFCLNQLCYDLVRDELVERFGTDKTTLIEQRNSKEIDAIISQL